MMPEIDESQQFVMDATSLLAYLYHDPGGPLVEKILRHCAQCQCKIRMASVDLLSAYAQIAEKSGSMLDEVTALFSDLPIEIVDFSVEMAARTAQIYAESPQLGLGGASSLYLSQSLGGTLLTADKNLYRLGVNRVLVVPQEETEADLPNTLDTPDNKEVM